jgi:iron complex transport system substrate-binding protein
MKAKVNRLSANLLSLFFVFLIFNTFNAYAADREIVDMAGRKVKVPENVTRVACMQGPTYEMVFALGGKNQISLVRDDHKSAYPLALKTNPDLKKIASLSGVGPQSPVNIEEFIKQDPDVVIYWNIPQELKKFDTAGIAAVVVNWSSVEPKNVQESLSDQKQKLHFLAEVLGDKALERYQKWSDYFDKTTDFIQSRLAGVPKSDYPSVYIGNSWGANILATWGAFSSNPYIVELCGGRFVGVKGPGMFPEVTREQLLGWAPDFLIVDNHGRDPEKVIQDLNTSPEWAPLPAVKNHRVYRIPSGVFFLDKGTSSPVFFKWLAQKLHPTRFEDLNIEDDLKFYFKTFYDYDLSTKEAEEALSGWVNEEAYKN